jgi:hypothetical protein
VPNGTELRDRDLPFREDLEQHGLELFIHFVDLVNQQCARALIQKSAKQRALDEKIERVQTRAIDSQSVPI